MTLRMKFPVSLPQLARCTDLFAVTTNQHQMAWIGSRVKSEVTHSPARALEAKSATAATEIASCLNILITRWNRDVR
jgi:hypothetical protein